MPRQELDLSLGVALSRLATRPGPFIVDSAENIGDNWIVAYFGTDDDRYEGRHNVIVTTDHVHASELRSDGAGADADFVAWVMTHRDEVLRLAVVGQQAEASSR
jgi:hypothetical protein